MLSGALKTTLPRVFPAQCCSRSIKTILLRIFFLYKVVWSLKDNIAQQLQWFNLCNVGPSRFQVCSLKDNITCCSGSIKTALHRIFFPHNVVWSLNDNIVRGLNLSHSMSNGPKFQRLGHDSSQILMKHFQMKSYIWDKVILKILAQTDTPFKSYDTSKLTW